MGGTLFIYPSPHPDESVRWLHLPHAGRPDASTTANTGSLEHAAAAATGARVVMFAPASELILLHAQVPGRNRARMLQALPYALEEQLAEDVERLHFAAGEEDENGIAVAIVAKTKLDAWLSMLHAVGIEPDAIVPDVMAVPWHQGQWSVVLDGEHCLVRTGTASGWAAERENLPNLLRIAFGNAASPEQLALYGRPDEKRTSDLDSLAVPLQWQSYSRDTLVLLAEHFRPGSSINLLQGAYRRLGETANSGRRWRGVAALGAILIAVQLGTLFAENHRLEQRTARTAKQIDDLFRADFPDIKRLVNAKAQMQQQLEALRNAARGPRNSDFLQLLQYAGPSLHQTDKVELRRLHYADQRLDVELGAPDFQTLDKLKRELLNKGLEVEIDSASAEEKGVAGRLRVRRGAS